jgi:hypothetical protein
MLGLQKDIKGVVVSFGLLFDFLLVSLLLQQLFVLLFCVFDLMIQLFGQFFLKIFGKFDVLVFIINQVFVVVWLSN